MQIVVPSNDLVGSLQATMARLASDHLRFFSAAWGIATLFHIVAQPTKLFSLTHGLPDFTNSESFCQALLLAAALFLLWRPGEPIRIFLLASAQVLDYVVNSPIASNHWTVTFFTALAIAIGGAVHLLSKPARGTIQAEPFFAYFAPVGRLVLLIMYLYGTFHKINADFLNPEASCAIHLYGLLATPFGLSDARWAQYAAMYGTLVIETCAILFLSIPRLRYFGFMIGLPFHAAIAISGQSVTQFNVPGTYYDFSSVVYALYILFLPQVFFERLREALADRGRFLAAAAAVALGIVAGLVLIALLFATGEVAFRGNNAFKMPIGVLCFVYGLSLWVAVLSLTRPADYAFERGLLVPRHAVPAAIAILFLLNGFSPYVGLKTESSIAMFSNLHTEGGQTNHLLFERPPYLFGFQEPVVEIVSSTDPKLQYYVDHGFGMVQYEFDRYLRDHPGTDVTYRMNGEVRSFEGGQPPPARTSWLLDKFLLFKPVDFSRPKACSH